MVPILSSVNITPRGWSPRDQEYPRVKKYDQSKVQALRLEKQIRNKWSNYIEEQRKKTVDEQGKSGLNPGATDQKFVRA